MEIIVVIGILAMLEVILSVDNALILGLMVQGLPSQLRRKALFYGIVGAYVLRGLALAFAAFFIKFWWAQALGGAYLLFVAFRYFVRRRTETPHAHSVPSSRQFWGTVAQIELMDLAFAIDSILVAVALSNQLWVIFTGVFLGIAALRLVASFFVGLLEHYPRFKTVAYVIVALAGVKLTLEGWDKLTEQVLTKPEWALHLDKTVFSLFILGVLGVGALWATRAQRT
ncbi:MAG: TerC family protein [Candidatus Bipolaricaulia bacterium]